MTDDRMALVDLLQKSGDGDFLRAVAEAVLQILMEADVEGLIGASRHERSAERLNYRNGYRERSLDTLAVLGLGHLQRQLFVDRVEKRLGWRHQQAGSQLVVLGLSNQVSRDIRRVSRVVREDPDLGRARLGVDADDTADQPFGRGDVDVARAGDDVGRCAVGGAVGEHGYRLRAARRVHLLDAEQGAGREHGRGRQSTVPGLRRRGHRDSGDPRHLGRDDVHDHRGRVGDQPAGHVDTGPAHRYITLGDGGAGCHGGHVVGRALRLVHPAGPPDRLLQRGPDPGVQGRQGVGHGGGGHPGGGEVHPVEAERVVPDRGPAAQAHVLADRPDLGERGVGVKCRTWQHSGELLSNRLAAPRTLSLIALQIPATCRASHHHDFIEPVRR